MQRLHVDRTQFDWDTISGREVCNTVLGSGLDSIELNSLESHRACNIEVEVGVHDVEDRIELNSTRWISAKSCVICWHVVENRIGAFQDRIARRRHDLSQPIAIAHVDEGIVDVITLSVSLWQSRTELVAPIYGR